MSQLSMKQSVNDLAIFGGKPLFTPPISTSNLVRPNFSRFLGYSRTMYEQHIYTNNGPLLKKLEQRLAEFHGTQFCRVLANGFWALVLCIKTLALPGRTEVIMPSLTYRRLADVVAWAGLKPCFCEVDAKTLAIDPEHVRQLIGAETALILAAHPIVNTCDAPMLEDVAAEQNIPLLFDSVESVYETIGGKKVGGFGSAECFSMHASKLINGFEGGYITTNDEILAQQIAMMRGFGFHGHDNIEMLGLNAKLSEVHAAMALAALDDLEDQIDRNRQRYRCYQELLARIPSLRLLPFDEKEKTSFKNIVVEILSDWPLDRELTLEILNREGALVRAYYSPALHTRAMEYPHVPTVLPLTERLSKLFMLLPCGHLVKISDIKTFIALLEFIADHAVAIKERLA
ncbi:aminotransferase class I/II-fold pyridoxal phosphate-dependent enzyme [Paludibacterium sp. dN 18-1]|uniref:Aminotransferase class I/II-fold pyridoxal phosphate-dependent enzyme n=2 Tax=Paludibacterium denitrificans TaxID=2675226 RepID=A0A844GAR6_9NEIS|nr:aminotransferase class I/II-fold pyridoxal phosphate-dependent enzyme [Paludibacterium denitrificans]